MDDDRTDPDGDLTRIEAGGIPAGAERRLHAMAADGAGFASALSVPEYALLARLGARPVAQVQGASVFQVGWQRLPALRGELANGLQVSGARHEYVWNETVICELDVIARAWDQVRRRARDRLVEEAVVAGADMVVGVHMTRGEHDWAKGTIDCLMSGTAIRWPGRNRAAWPALSNLSVQDYFKLQDAGYEPAGVIATTAVVFASPGRATRLARLTSTTRNQELEELSKASRAALDEARARVRGQVDADNGLGAVGVELTHTVSEQRLALENPLAQRSPGWQRGQLGLPARETGASDMEREGWVVTVHAAGTVIRQEAELELFAPERTVSLGAARLHRGAGGPAVHYDALRP